MYSAALNDIKESIKKWPFWIYMAWFDVKITYRGSLMGPFWITLSMAIFVTALSVVYGRLFHQNIKTYIPFLLCGFLNWYLISTIIINSCEMLIQYGGFITQIKVPFFTYFFRHISKNLIIYGHNFLVYLGVILIFKLNPGWTVLLAIPGLLLLLLNLIWVVVFISMVSARYRDLPPIVASLVQICFFISPITWMPQLLGSQSMILKYNPITYLLDVVRDPLLGIMPPWYSWVVVIGMFILETMLILPFFAKYRMRIPFWVL